MAWIVRATTLPKLPTLPANSCFSPASPLHFSLDFFQGSERQDMVDAVRGSTLPNLRTNVVTLVVEWLGQSRDTSSQGVARPRRRSGRDPVDLLTG